MGYLVLLIYIYIVRILMRQRNNKNSKTELVLMMIGIFVFIGFRGRGTGSDTWNYLEKFMRMRYVNFSDIRLTDGNEIGFMIFEKVLVTLFPYEQIILIAQAVIVTVSYGFFIYRYCWKDYFLPVLIFMSFGLLGFHMTGVRQSIAMSLCIWMYMFVEEKKYVRAMLFVVLAMSFHTSAFVVLLYFVFGAFWKRNNNIVTAILLSAVCYLSVPRVLSLMSGFVERWESYADIEATGNGEIYFLILLIIAVVVELAKGFIDEDEMFHVRINYLTLIFWTGRLATRTFERPCMYFYPATMPAFVNSLDGYNEKSRRLVYVCAVSLISVFYIYRFHGSVYESVLIRLL